jgi:hypothetical protein
MIRVTCPTCGSKLNAKDEIAGETRKCPKCAQPVYIIADALVEVPSISLIDTPPLPGAQEEMEESLQSSELPVRLNRECHYLICDKNGLAATWSNDGNGWMVKAGPGFQSAKRNRDTLPAQGDFKLVELKFTVTPEGKHLSGLTTYQLATRWALTSLNQGDDPICEKITGNGSLNREQKNVVRQALRDQFMRPVWENAASVLEYLGNADFHSSSVG